MREFQGSEFRKRIRLSETPLFVHTPRKTAVFLDPQSRVSSSLLNPETRNL